MTRPIPAAPSLASPPDSIDRLVIGTRGSALALWQAGTVRDLLQAAVGGLEATLQVIRPEGDLDKHSSLLTIGGRGVFASALQEALLDGSIDLAVHSTKDVPTIEPAGLAIAAFPQREDPRDAVVSRHGTGLEDLPPDPVIGTSSRRRSVQVRAIRPDARIVDLRGNIDTRLRKAESDAYDAVILAAAGLARMGWQDRITSYLPLERFVPSPGQGALAIETRAHPDPAWAVVAALDDPAVSAAVRLERAFLRAVGGGCTTPLGAHAVLDGEVMRFWAMMASDDGERVLHVAESWPTPRAEDEAGALATRMMTDLAPRHAPAGVPGVLARRQALITGTRGLATRLAGAFERAGAMPLEAPTLEVHPTSDPDGLDAALTRLGAGVYDWLVVTSQQTVPVLASLGPDRFPASTRILTVGTTTGRALEEAGYRVEAVPRDQDSAGVVALLDTMDLQGARVLCLFGDRAGTDITEALDARGANVDRVESYRTIASATLPQATRDAVRMGRVDLAVFPSPASARTLVDLLGVDLAALSGACLVAIGRTTARAMADLGLPVHVVAGEPSPDGVVAACTAYFAARRGLGKTSHDPA